MSHSPAQLYTQPTFLELFTPKLITVFREGYGWRDLRADAVSGLTVAVVALPLSMAIAIAIHSVSRDVGFTAGIAVICRSYFPSVTHSPPFTFRQSA